MLDKIAIPVELADVQRLLWQHYGFAAELRPLTGERDYNFLATKHDGTKLIVKIAHEDESPATLQFQSKVIAQIQQQAPHVPVSKEIPNLQGQGFSTGEFLNGPRRYMRVNSFIDGTPLCDVERTAATRRAVGALAASLACALIGFRDPAESRVLLWDIQQARSLAPHVETLPASKKALVSVTLAQYLQNCAPVSSTLPQGVIHNDLNLHNLFVDAADHGRITGCIDFGDMVRAPLINDLAVATAYQLDPREPLQSIAEIAKAYHAVRPLLPAELDHLVTLIAMRCVLTLVITHWRSKLHPENASYILRNATSAWTGLHSLHDISPARSREYLYDQLSMKMSPLP
jgi:hydroxylysine kinase